MERPRNISGDVQELRAKAFKIRFVGNGISCILLVAGSSRESRGASSRKVSVPCPSAAGAWEFAGFGAAPDRSEEVEPIVKGEFMTSSYTPVSFCCSSVHTASSKGLKS